MGSSVLWRIFLFLWALILVWRYGQIWVRFDQCCRKHWRASKWEAQLVSSPSHNEVKIWREFWKLKFWQSVLKIVYGLVSRSIHNLLVFWWVYFLVWIVTQRPFCEVSMVFSFSFRRFKPLKPHLDKIVAPGNRSSESACPSSLIDLLSDRI